MADNERFRYLFKQYAVKEAAEQERSELFTLLDSGVYNDLLMDLIDEQWNGEIPEWIRSNDAQKAEANFEAIMRRVKVKKMNFRRIAVAAAVILLIASAAVFGVLTNNHRTKTTPVAQTHDVAAPKETRAVITLADGTKVYLDSVTNGTIAQESGANVVKSESGAISYQPLAVGKGEVAYNTLTNPRGSKVIDMTLSDGSHVWLNAGSSVRYPVAFVGSERRVEITGEAYFEVAHFESPALNDLRSKPPVSPYNKGGRANALPFIVRHGDVSVTVLGTHFNVNAYDDEDAIRITLLEGSVRVDANKSSLKILPGSQAVLEKGHYLWSANNPDLDVVMAWKNGRFEFKSTDLKSIMREIARWYDVDVSYEGNVANETITGEISRTVNVSEVMKMLDFAGIKFRIEGRKVTVLR